MPYDKDSIAPFVGSARAGFELIEDRGADYSRLAVNPLIMDAGWNGGSLLAKPNKDWAKLSDREREVLACLVRGMSYKAVARELDISIDTVRSHIRGVYGKLQVHSVAEAVSRALQSGLI